MATLVTCGRCVYWKTSDGREGLCLARSPGVVRGQLVILQRRATQSADDQTVDDWAIWPRTEAEVGCGEGVVDPEKVAIPEAKTMTVATARQETDEEAVERIRREENRERQEHVNARRAGFNLPGTPRYDVAPAGEEKNEERSLISRVRRVLVACGPSSIPELLAATAAKSASLSCLLTTRKKAGELTNPSRGVWALAADVKH